MNYKVFYFIFFIMLIIFIFKYSKLSENFSNKLPPYQIEFSDYPLVKMIDNYKKNRNKCVTENCKEKSDKKFINKLKENKRFGDFCGLYTNDSNNYRNFDNCIISTKKGNYNNQYKQTALYYGTLPKSLNKYCNKINDFQKYIPYKNDKTYNWCDYKVSSPPSMTPSPG